MRVAANLSFLYTELPLLQRYGKAAADGFRLVEVPLPYDERPEELRDTADLHGIKHVAINAPTGDWSSGWRGLAAVVGPDEFRKSIETAIDYAKILECPRVHVMAGIADPAKSQNSDKYRENIRMAAEMLRKEGLICLIEPINHYSVPGYFLTSYDYAAQLIEETPGLKLQFDIFHAQLICGQLTYMLTKYKDIIGHIQVAQVPYRNEPSSEGEINYKFMFKFLSELGLDSVFGCEYKPTEADKKQWVAQYGLQF